MGSVIRSVCILVVSFTVSSAQLPPEILVDKYLIHAEQLHAAKDHAAAFEVMQKIIALQKEHSLAVPDDFHFKYAQVALSADSMRIALESVTRYLAATGKKGAHYQKALKLMLKAEGNEVMSAEDFYNDVIKAEGTCNGMPEGSSCWMALTNHAECFVWNDYLDDGETATWQGKCSGHVPDGEGTLTWYVLRNKDGERTKVKLQENTGLYLQGKRHGRWVYRNRNGVVREEGLYINGKKDGKWIKRRSGGDIASEGTYVDGERDGQWVFRDEYRVSEGRIVNGKRQGQWVTRCPDGSVLGGPYVNGEKHGHWVVSSSGGQSCDSGHLEGTYVNDKKHGEWIERYSYGDKKKGLYNEGEKDGTWLEYDRSENKCWFVTYRRDNQIDKKKVNKKNCLE